VIVGVAMSKSKDILENVLQEAAQNGETDRLIELLEMGAPFVVDAVRNKYFFIISPGLFSVITFKTISPRDIMYKIFRCDEFHLEYTRKKLISYTVFIIVNSIGNACSQMVR
jgi:hypothetical protein